jgi:hypothetical protein
MKLYIFNITTFFLIVSSFAQNLGEVTNATDFKKLQQELLSLKDLMAQDTVLHSEAIPLELNIRRQVDNIYLDMNTRLPHLDGRLTPEWKEFTSKLAEILRPHEDIILEAAYRPLMDKNRKKTQLNRLTYNADQLVGFLKPDHEVELLMREKLVQYPTLRWQIYRHLHELRLLRETDIKDMEMLGTAIRDPNEKIKWAEEVSFYGSDAGLDTLERIISSPFDPEGLVNERGEPEGNKSFTSYEPVSRAVRSLGKKAQRLLPIIIDREQEVRNALKEHFSSDVVDQGSLMFKIMQMSIRGEVNPYSSARNRSGLLYPPGQEPANQIIKQDNKTPSGDLSLRPKKQRDLNLVESSRRPFESSSFLNWLLTSLAVAILAVVYFMLIRSKMRRKKLF